VHDESESSRRIRAGALTSYAAFAINVAYSLLYLPWIIGQVGPDDYGLYVLGLSMITIFLTDLGLGEAVAKFVSKRHSEGDEVGASNLVGIFFRLYLAFDALIVCVLFVIYFQLARLYPALSGEQLSSLKVIFVIAASAGLIGFPFLPLNGILIAYERFSLLKGLDLVQRIVAVALITIALVGGLGLYGLVLANAVSSLVVLGAKVFFVLRFLPVRPGLRGGMRSIVPEILRFSMWTAVAVLAQLLVFNVSPSLIGAFSGAREIAVFGVASSLEGYVYTLAASLNGLFLPKVTRMAQSGGPRADGRMLALTIRVGRFQFVVLGAAVIAFLSFGQEFIRLWLEGQLSGVYACAVLMIVPSFFYLPLQVANSAIIAHDLVRLQAVVFLVMGVVNVLAVSFLAARWGALGGSLGIFLAYTVRNVGMHAIYSRALKLDLSTFYRKAFFPLLPVMVATLLIGGLVNWALPGSGWGQFVMKACSLMVAYGLLMWFVGVSEEERRWIREFVVR